MAYEKVLHFVINENHATNNNKVNLAQIKTCQTCNFTFIVKNGVGFSDFLHL